MSVNNRRLVPMPAKRSPRRGKAPAAPAGAIAPSGLKSWHAFTFLIVAAVVWYLLKWPLIVIGLLVGFFWSLH